MALPHCISRTVLLLLLLLCSPGVPLIQLWFQLAGISLQKKKKKLQQKIPTRLAWCLLSRPTVTLHHSLGGCGLFSQGDAHPDHFHPPPQHQELQDASRVTDPWLLTLHSSTRETHCHSSPKILQDQVQDQSPAVLWSPGCFNATATGAEQCR